MRLEDLIGRRIGRYEISEVLGRGGMAAVYRARDTVLRRDVALKVLYPQFLGDTALVERFQREAVLAAGLDHPNILPIYDVGETDGLVYIAMRLLSGQSFADALRLRRAIPADELLPIVDQIAAALDYAHARQVVHRDIKPANILLQSDEAQPDGSLINARAVLTDFGIAKSLDPAASGLTVTGVLVGTPEYMAPEQIRGGHLVDGRADIYALGVLVYRALTGRRPFEGSTQEVLLGHLQGTIAAPSSIDPSLAPALNAVVLKALARDPAARYPSAGAFARALRSAAGLELPTPPPAMRRPADGRVVIPSVAVGGLEPDRAGGTQATRRGDAAPPYAARNLGPTSAQTTRRNSTPAAAPRSGSNLGWALLGVLLALLIGGGVIYAARMLVANRSPGGSLAEVLTATPDLPLPTAIPSAAETATETTPATSTLAATEAATAPASTAAPSTEPPAATSAPARPTTRPTTKPTARPTARPAPTPTNQPTNSPAPSATPSATPTLEPSATATPEPPVPTPCAIAAAPDFAAFLESHAQIGTSFGCATQAAQNRPIAEQNFERGAMIWVAGSTGRNGTIYVIFDDEARAKTTWQVFEDTWQEGDPEDSGDETPPSGRYEPQRGFGKLWYANKDIYNTLGWAKEEREHGSAGVIQRFTNGRLLYTPYGFGAGASVYVLDQDGGFAQYEAP